MKKQLTKLFVLVAMMMPLALLAQAYHAVPYFENFDSPTGSPALPTGWVNYQTGNSSAATFPCCYEYSGNARSGSYYFELESSSGQTEVCATPEFANPAGLLVDFYYCINNSYAPSLFEIGVMEDSTFVPVDTLNFTTTSSWNTYTHAVVSLASYTGDGHRIAFRVSRNSAYTVFIDDMTFMSAPGCPNDPGAASAINVDSTSATLTWGAASTSAGYFVFLNNDSTWYFASDTSYTFTGLTANTLYTGYIYNTCDGTDTSLSVSFSFRTACGMPVFPMFEDFNSYGSDFPSCWHRYQISGSYPQMTTSGRTGRGIDMYSYSADLAIATPYLYDPINTFETKFWARKSSSYYDCNLVVGYTSTVASTDSMVALQTFALTTDWTEYYVTFAGTNMTESGHIVFRKQAGGYGSCYLDDITIRPAGNCVIPYDFAVTGTASGELSFAWTDTLGSAWEIAYGTPGFDPDTAVNVETFNDAFGTIQSLEDTLTYDFYLRTDCGSEYSYWVGPVTSRPNLIVMQANVTDTINTCGGTIVDDGGLDGNFATNQTSYLIVRPNEAGKTVSLRGIASTVGTYSYYANTLTIYEGIGTSGRVLGTYSNTNNDSVNVSSSVGPLTLKFESSYYEGAGFELQVECLDMANCTDPYDVNLTDVAGGSAVVNWSYGDATTPDYFTIAVTDTASGATDTYTAADTARSFLISGLNQTTNYRVSVTANCGGDDSNPDSAYFTTTCYVGGTVECGDGSVSLNHIINTYYNYSICQMLFTSDELLALQDTVYGIEFYVNSATSASVPLDIYLDTTSVSTLSSYIVMDSSDMVWSGSVVLTPGVNTFRFATPFVRSSMTSGLVLTLDNNSGSYTSNSYIRGTGGLTGKTRYQYSDGTNYDPQTSLSISSTDNRANISFLAPCGDANCVAPNVTVGAATTSSITLNWVPGLSESQWTVDYKLHSDTTWTVAEATTTMQTATINGLSANTEYDFRVGSLCIVGTTTPYTYVTGRTACGVMARASLPYTEGFEGLNTGDRPSCWLAPVTGVSSYGTFPMVYNSSYNAHGGSNFFEFEASSGGTEVFAMPAVDTVDGLQLDFYVATSSYYAPTALELGIWEGDSAFVVLDTIDISDCSGMYSTAYRYKSYRIHYTGLDARIAMRATKASNYTLYLDDFTLYVPNPCDSVTNIVIDSLASDRIDISWTDTNASGSYLVKIGTSNDPTLATDSATVINTNYSFTMLTPATTYYIFVYNDCGTGLSEVNQITVTTECLAHNTFPFTEDFESGFSACYRQEYVSGSHSWTSTTTSSNPSGAHSGTMVAAYTHTSNGSETMLVLPTFDFTALTTGAQLSFYHTQASWAGDQDELHVYYRTSTTGTWTLLQSYTNNITDWTEETMSLPNSASAPVYQIGFKGVDSYGYGVKLDDITVMAASNCARPEMLNATTTDVSALLSWYGNSDSYEIEYNQVGDTTVYTTTSLDSTVTVSGLTPVTTYQFRVRGICGGTDTTRWSVYGTFTTELCANAVVAINRDSTMDNTTSSHLPGQSYYNYSYTEVLVDSVFLAGMTDITAFAFETANGTAGNRFTNCDIYFGLTTDTLLNTWHYDSTYMHVYHGDLTYTSAGWQTFALDTTFTWDGHSNLVVCVNRLDGNYANGATFVSHHTSGNHGMYYYDDYDPCDLTNFSSFDTWSSGATDNIPNYKFISCNDGCAAPTILGETHDYENVTISWVGSGSSYEVAIKENGVADWPTEIAVAGNSYTFTGLNPATAYTYRVRQDCTVDTLGYSNWTMGTVITDSLPCLAPESVVISNISNAEATVAWTARGTETNWEIHVWAIGVSDQNFVVTTNPATVNGFVAGVTYNVAVRALCGSALVEGDWSDTVTFTTLTCPDVTGLATSNVTFNSVDLSWETNPMAQSWIIEYGFAGFNQGQGITVNVTTNSYSVTNLTDETNYDFYVRAVCGADWTSESWAHVSAMTAVMPEDVVTVTLLVNDPTMGTVSGAGTYATGSEVTISATANEGYQFDNWSDGNTEATRTLVVNDNITLTANFSATQVEGIDEVNGATCTIYPNPATSSTTINVAGVNGKVRISVVDINGRVVATDMLECNADCVKTMDVDNLAQGAYFVRITGENVNMVKKLVVR